MSKIDSFLRAHADAVDAALGEELMECLGQSFPVVVNEIARSAGGEEIGYMDDHALAAMAQTRKVSNPESMLNRRCTVSGKDYRVARIRLGTVAITFELAHPSKV